MIRSLTVLLAAALAAACASTEYRIISTEPLKNENGHVVGHKERLRDVKTSEEFEQIIEYTPRRDEKGVIIGYEEPVREGTMLRDVNGRRIGVRYSDLRSRGSNPGNEGVQVQVKPQQP
jgi:hypothetical protein